MTRVRAPNQPSDCNTYAPRMQNSPEIAAKWRDRSPAKFYHRHAPGRLRIRERLERADEIRDTHDSHDYCSGEAEAT